MSYIKIIYNKKLVVEKDQILTKSKIFLINSKNLQLLNYIYIKFFIAIAQIALVLLRK